MVFGFLLKIHNLDIFCLHVYLMDFGEKKMHILEYSTKYSFLFAFKNNNTSNHFIH